MPILFEVPYNFALSLLPFYERQASSISFLFLPPYHADSINTRSSIETKRVGRCYMPQSREEYECHLGRIVASGLRFVVLWQDPRRVITKNELDYYCSNGASGFIVSNIDNARVIKKYNPNLIVIASLVQRLCENVSKIDLDPYDKVILYYPFNRALDALKYLQHIRDKIVLMPNTLCHVDCQSMHHWFPTRPFVQQRDCLVVKDRKRYLNNCGFISPEHLYLFDDYIGGYKLQGREFSTDLLKYTCQLFFKRDDPFRLLEGMLGKDFAVEYHSAFEQMTLEEYYNVKTSSVLKLI